MTDLEKAAGRVDRQWHDHDTNVSIRAMIKSEMLLSWPELYGALEDLSRHVTGARLRGENI